MTGKTPPRLGLSALQRLQQISLEILGQLDLDRVLESVLQGAALLLDASQVNLYRHIPEHDCLATWIPFLAPDDVPPLELKRGEGAAGSVLASGRAIKIDDYDRWAGRTRKWPTGVTGPAMAVPVSRGQELLGVITTSRRPGDQSFTAKDLELFQLFANQAAVAIANAQLYAGATRRAEELSKLYDTSLDVVSQLDLGLVLQATLERATDLLDCAANLRLHDPENDLLIPLLPFKQSGEIAYAALRPGEGLSGRVFLTGKALAVSDYDSWEGRSHQYQPGVIGRAMAAPLREGSEVIGVLALDRSADSPAFTNDDLQLLSLFANQVSVAITNSNQVSELRLLHAQQIEKERLDQQVRTAGAVQAGLLPTKPPDISGWDVAALWRPALELGGDYYDYLPLGDHHWAFLMADVSDKGIPAALLMAVTRSLFRVYAGELSSPTEVLSRLNGELVASSHSGMFVTAVYAVLDTLSGSIRLSAAGHPPPLLTRHSDRQTIPLKAGGMPLGILADAKYSQVEARLEPMDSLLLYTDGATEAGRRDGDLFGEHRLRETLQASPVSTAEHLIRDIDAAVGGFIHGEAQSDDVAYLVVRREA